MVKTLIPTSERAKRNIELIAEGLPKAYQVIEANGPVSLANLGLDWNHTTLERTRRKGIDFSLTDAININSLSGNVKNGGYNIPLINVYNLIGHMSDDYVFNSLGEAISVVSKLNIQDEVEFLPMGEIGPRDNRGESTQRLIPDHDEYRTFLGELVTSAEEIIVGRVNKQFGDYVVARTPIGFYLAYNRDYGKAPYVVADVETLLKDRQSIRRDGDAIRVVRNGNWIEKLREYLYPKSIIKTA